MFNITDENGWMVTLIQWTWTWANSRSWWGTGRPGMLQSMGLQRVGHDCVTELNWTKQEFPWGGWSFVNCRINSLAHLPISLLSCSNLFFLCVCVCVCVCLTLPCGIQYLSYPTRQYICPLHWELRVLTTPEGMSPSLILIAIVCLLFAEQSYVNTLPLSCCVVCFQQIWVLTKQRILYSVIQSLKARLCFDILLGTHTLSGTQST